MRNMEKNMKNYCTVCWQDIPWMFMDSFLGAQRPPHVCVLKDAPTLRLEDRFKPFCAKNR